MNKERTPTLRNPIAYTFKVIAILVGVVFIGIYLLGLSIDEKYSHSRMTLLGKPQQHVWNLVSDFNTNHLWRRPYLRDVEAVSKAPKEIWQENYVGGDSVKWLVTEKTAPSRLVKVMQEGPIESQWAIDIQKIDDNSCKLIVTESGTIKSPFSRFFSKVSIGSTYVDQFIMDVAKAFKEKHKIIDAK